MRTIESTRLKMARHFYRVIQTFGLNIMKLTSSEEIVLKKLRNPKKDALFGLAFLVIGLVNGILCIRHSGEIHDMVDLEMIDPNTLLLYKSLGWGFMGIASILLGFTFAMWGSRRTDSLLLKLYNRIQKIDEDAKEPPNQ